MKCQKYFYACLHRHFISHLPRIRAFCLLLKIEIKAKVALSGVWRKEVIATLCAVLLQVFMCLKKKKSSCTQNCICVYNGKGKNKIVICFRNSYFCDRSVRFCLKLLNPFLLLFQEFWLQSARPSLLMRQVYFLYSFLLPACRSTVNIFLV